MHSCGQQPCLNSVPLHAPPAPSSVQHLDTGSTGLTWTCSASRRLSGNRWWGWPESCTVLSANRTSHSCWRGWLYPAARPVTGSWGPASSRLRRRLVDNEDRQKSRQSHAFHKSSDATRHQLSRSAAELHNLCTLWLLNIKFNCQ